MDEYKIEVGVTQYGAIQLLKAQGMKPPSPLSIALNGSIKTEREPHVGAPVNRTYVG